MTGGDVERELRSILRGDNDFIYDFTMNLPDDIKLNYVKIINHPFVVARAAGSFGIDLIAIRNDFSFPIEVKSSSQRVIRLSRNKRIKEQAEWLKRECLRAKILPIYAYRLKRIRNEDPWRIFTLPLEEGGVEGRSRFLYNLLPKLELTLKGNLKLDWKTGMPLHKLIEYLCTN